MNRAKILVIDDDPTVLSSVVEYLVLEGYSVRQAATVQAALEALEDEAPDIAICDFELPDGSALNFLAAIKKANAHTDTIVLTGHGTIDLAVKSIKEGAEQFFTKPVQFSVLGSFISACLEHQQNKRKQLARKHRRSRYEKDPFQGTSDVIRSLELEVHKIMSTERPILIHGQTGTGKGVLAEWIHKHGPRAEEAFVDINCAGLSRDLLESELFGYEKGAFTGATGTKLGLIEVAHRGILFLDEVGEMDLTVQPKLLKVLEDRRFRRLGDVHLRTADVQVIAATNRDLMQSVKEQKFREDLYYRVATFQLRIPALRERPEDIPELARAILSNLAKDLARDQQELGPAAVEALKIYDWPGNIRELRNLLERVAITCESGVIEPKDLGLAPGPRAPLAPPADTTEDMTLGELERRHITRVLEQESGKVAQAAARLGIPRSTLYQKIKAYGIALP